MKITNTIILKALQEGKKIRRDDWSYLFGTEDVFLYLDKDLNKLRDENNNIIPWLYCIGEWEIIEG